MRVYKVAEIVNGAIHHIKNSRFKPGDVAAELTELSGDPNPAFQWTFFLTVGKGPTLSELKLTVPCPISKDANLEKPVFLEKTKIIYFRDRFFMPERLPATSSEQEEIELRARKIVYDENAELASLRAAVANMEATLRFSKSESKREPIPEDVKLLVWTRDCGACTSCGSKTALHFDHIIPVVKGGGYSAENIQILCQRCNLKKADKIAGG